MRTGLLSAQPSLTADLRELAEGVAKDPKAFAYGIGLENTEGCTGARVFFSGTDKKTGDKLWSVGCTDGRDFMVTLHRDSITFLDCKMLWLVAKVRCYEKLD